MKVTVTQQDINRATRLCEKKLCCKKEFWPTAHGDVSGCCPISLAVKRMTHKAVDTTEDEISVYRRPARDKGLRTRVYYDLPKRATCFIAHFDSGKNVRPIAFTVRPGKGPEYTLVSGNPA